MQKPTSKRKASGWAVSEKPRARLCLASETFYPVYAGPAVRFARYLPGLAARGIEVQVFSGTPNIAFAETCFTNMDWRDSKIGELLPQESLHGVEINRVRLPEAVGRRRPFLFSNRLVDFCRHPDAGPSLVQLLACRIEYIPALVRLRRLRIPTVFTLTLLPNERGNRLKRALRRRYIAQPLQLVSCIVVSSEVMREALREIRIATPTRVIPNGVDTLRFSPALNVDERQAVRRQLGIGPEDAIVLFVGPINPRKGVDLLLRSWSRLVAGHRRLQLVIVGPGLERVDRAEAAFRSEVRKLAANSGAPDRIHFTGLIENVEDYMRAADVFVFTSRREGMPNVIPEAMAAGLPVITTPFIGLPCEFGAPGRQYLLADFDPDSIAVEIDALLSNERRRTELGQSARKWVEEHLDVERSIDSYADLYVELAANSHPRKESNAAKR